MLACRLKSCTRKPYPLLPTAMGVDKNRTRKPNIPGGMLHQVFREEKPQSTMVSIPPIGPLLLLVPWRISAMLQFP